jgi:metal-responsive CopG/Arc/MetJ family transcriptional regulator
MPLNLLNQVEDYAMINNINRSEAIIRLIRHGLNYLTVLEKQSIEQTEKGNKEEPEKKD